jgi:hypothetical protein
MDILLTQGSTWNTSNISYIMGKDIQTHIIIPSADWLYFEDMQSQGYNYSIAAHNNTNIYLNSLGRYYSGPNLGKNEYLYMLTSPQSLILNYSDYNLTSYSRKFTLNYTEDKAFNSSLMLSGSNTLSIGSTITSASVPPAGWTNLNATYNRSAAWGNSSLKVSGNASMYITDVGTGADVVDSIGLNLSNLTMSEHWNLSFYQRIPSDSCGGAAATWKAPEFYCKNGYVSTRTQDCGDLTDTWVKWSYRWNNATKVMETAIDGVETYNDTYPCDVLTAAQFVLYPGVAPAGGNVTILIDDFYIQNIETGSTIYLASFDSGTYETQSYAWFESNNITRLGQGFNFRPTWAGSCTPSNCKINITIDGNRYQNVVNNTLYNYSNLTGKSLNVSILLINSGSAPIISNFSIEFNPLVSVTFYINDADTNISYSDIAVTVANTPYNLRSTQTGVYSTTFLMLADLEYTLTFQAFGEDSFSESRGFSRDTTYYAGYTPHFIPGNGTTNISIYDANNRSLITWTNVSIELISDYFSDINITTSGKWYYSNLSSGLYLVRANAENYFEGTYYVYLQDNVSTQVDLYLAPNETYSEILMTIYDQSSTALPNAYIEVMEYITSTNTYVTNEIIKTNFEGETKYHAKINQNFYKFIVEYPFGTVRLITNGTYIYKTTSEISINTVADTLNNFFNTNDLVFSLLFNNATKNIVFTYSDVNNQVVKTNMTVYQLNYGDRTYYDSSVIQSPAGSMLINLDDSSNTTYDIRLYLYYNETGNVPYYLTSYLVTFDAEKVAGYEGLWLTLLLTIAFAFLAIWIKEFALMLIPIPTMIMAYLNFIDISFGVALAVEVLMVILCLYIARGRE